MYRVLILFAFLLPFSGFAQRIAGLNLVASEAFVGVRFTITKGSSCNGYSIYHSLDSVNFKVIYDYAGVCGSSASDDQKSYTHTSPTPNRVNYYKVDLWPVETSRIVGILIPAETESGILLYPNPISGKNDQLTLKLPGASSPNIGGLICDQFGKTLQPLNLQVQNNQTSFETAHLQSGVYTVKLMDGQQTYVSKFVILR